MSTNSRNPGLDYGGTWQLWGQGKVPVGIDTSDTDFNEIEKTGGEKLHILTIDELAEHGHTITANSLGASGRIKVDQGNYASVGNPVNDISIGKTGRNQPHNNIQPYIVCYMWKKIA